MTNTLIVRDATLAVNGSPEARGELDEHLRQRVGEVASFDAKTVEDCMNVLLPSAGAKDADPEVLEALTVLGLSRPELANDLGISAVTTGRRLAARLEKSSQSEHAMAVLELLTEHFPGHKALERDLAALMRRKGMVQDLVNRYLDRAQGLLKRGKSQEALEWLREVILLDRSRKDVARMIRDLRFQEVDTVTERRRRWRFALGALAVSLILTAGFLREYVIRESYESLPTFEADDLGSLRHRLKAVEGFIEQHQAWHGSLKVLGERAHLRVEIERMEEALRREEEERHSDLARRREEANLARDRGLMAADSRDFVRALAEFELALETASPDWPMRERVEKDIQSIHDYLESEKESK